MDIKEIQNLIKFVAKSGASEVKLEIKDVKITIKTGSGTTETTIVQAPMQGMAPVAVAPLLNQHAGHARQGQGAWRLSGSPWALSQAWAS